MLTLLKQINQTSWFKLTKTLILNLLGTTDLIPSLQEIWGKKWTQTYPECGTFGKTARAVPQQPEGREDCSTCKD